MTFNVNEGVVSASATATCTSGVLLGGGAEISGSAKAAVHDSHPTSAGTGGGWTANAIGTGPGSSGTGTITAYVICSGP